ncbi:MAG: GNAT family N-acetyltransferase [Planctomycetes bacterium]|nr:GNAT family N-acetyltransferase [Planctomycetota bacterium]
MQIEDLRSRPEFVPTLAAWHHAQWGELNPQNTLEARVERMQRSLHEGPIPSTFVAVEDDHPLGSASLVAHDLPTRPELTPWLASVFVAPEHRRRGIGSRLVQRVVEEAWRLQFETLYLFTLDQEKLYGELGWSPRERTDYNGFAITIMTIRS